MSGARRQSGRLAQQALLSAKEPNTANSPTQVNPKKTSGTRKTKDDSADEDDAFEDSEEDSGIESDASEFGKRPLKRQKVIKKAPATARKPSGKRKAADSTCHLTVMPLDVLIEIFGRLEPKGLILLSRTNHTFRSYLLSSAAKGVWKTARENSDGPDCPSDLSEQQWAHLLYAEARCQLCGARNVHRVDFGLRRRACTGCLKANLVVTSSFKNRFPDLEAHVLDLIPYTNIGGFAHGHASRSKFYWRQDIIDMAEKLGLYQRDVHMRAIGACQKLEDFTAQRVAFVNTVVKHAALCRDWSKQLAIRRAEEANQKVQGRYNAIKDRFLQLGYTYDDVSSIRYETSVNQPTQLTDRIWKNIFPQLEPTVKASKDRRLKAERYARIADRIRLLENVYKRYRKSLAPAQWRFLPGLYEVRQHPAFSAVVNAPDDVNVEMAHFDEAAGALPEFVASWRATRKVALAQQIADGTASPASAQSLDLATSVFLCAQSPCSGDRWFSASSQKAALIGWESAAAHRCHDSRYYYPGQSSSIETTLQFSQRGYAAAASLVALAGFQEKRATAAEMDELDLRFLCLVCPSRIVNKQHTFSAFSWRAAVSHFIAGSHTALLWRQLNEAEAAQVKTKEGSDPTLSWSCNHCSHHLDNCQTFTNVAEHVKAVHAIANPTAPDDLFRYLDLPRTPATFSEPRVLVQQGKVSTAGQYNCLKCATLGPKASRRLFILDGVKSHLKAKHNVVDSIPNVDWKLAQA
ncbi:hypothetical protein B0H19DRAFT_1100844 [Mycena capillaripes]|nr:hypothetical protein B0H19DRAFT_1100844 [Mycena capillaripes]